MVSVPGIEQLRAGIRGSLVLPRDAEYDSARRIFNAMIDRCPAVIVRCTCAEDVIAGLQFAQQRGLPIAVRGGGHSVSGAAVCDDGVVIDLEPMKAIRVDAENRTTHAQPGLRLGEFDRATQAHGLATTLGVASDTGIAGLTLGGGLGWLNGRFGLACDNVRSFEVVTADARVVTASVSEHPDLYWALRGGSGNFGVVTAFEYQLHQVGQTILGGMIAFPFSRAREVLRAFLDFSQSAPDELSTVGALLSLPNGTPVVAVAICYCGSLDEGTKVVAPLRQLGGAVVDAIQPMPYVAQQSLMDDAFPPKGNFHYWKSAFTRSMTDDGLDVFIESMAQTPSPLTFAYFQQLHGAAARVGPSDTAFPHRGYRYDFAFLTQWRDSAETDANVRWTQDAFAAMKPHLDIGVYVNNLGNEGDERVRAAFGSNYQRLAEIKARWDPSNLFRSTHNIAPLGLLSA
jgi:hypothetical protein